MQWEYKTVVLDMSPAQNDETLNQLGAAGWQINTVTPSTTEAYAIAYMQRPVTNGARQASLKDKLFGAAR